MKKSILLIISIVISVSGACRATGIKLQTNIPITTSANTGTGTQLQNKPIVLDNTGNSVSGEKEFITKYYIPDMNFWLTFMTILSTLLAVFFIYSGFKINDTVEKIEQAEKRIRKLEEDVKDDVEFSNQLRYAISFLFTRQYEKAIDALIVLRSEPFVLKNSDRLNTCYFLLATSYYELGTNNNDDEALAKAVQFVHQAIEDPNHPFKQEVIKAFEKMSSSAVNNEK